MTITVEAGMKVRRLSEILAAENQRWPVDAPRAEDATVGGVVATAAQGPRRCGWGKVRDSVIGVTAVDGQGTIFRGGGRVVKNVAGYDFCKLLTGSLGTLAVITQLTLRVRPVPPAAAVVLGAPRDLPIAEQALATLLKSEIAPSAVELVCGSDWQEHARLVEGRSAHSAPLLLAVALEGTHDEVAWMFDRLKGDWTKVGIAEPRLLESEAAASLLADLVEYPAAGEAPLTLRASVLPSALVGFLTQVRRVCPHGSFQAHAASGIANIKLPEFPPDGLTETLADRLQPLAREASGGITTLANPSGQEMTRQNVWGGVNAMDWLMDAVKHAFDPKNLLNPGRFVYA
jgi:glycolate oxidase FAD binding subunit